MFLTQHVSANIQEATKKIPKTKRKVCKLHYVTLRHQEMCSGVSRTELPGSTLRVIGRPNLNRGVSDSSGRVRVRKKSHTTLRVAAICRDQF